MTTWAVLATGESMSQALADSVRGKCKVAAVSDAIKLAPWADILVSADGAWWRHNKPEFEGPKYTLAKVPDTEIVEDVPMGTNSGLVALRKVVSLGATRVLLLGIDLHGTHYFGPHTGGLKNTSPQRMEVFRKQFESYKPKGVEILNCSAISHLTAYPKANLEQVLEGMAEPASPNS